MVMDDKLAKAMVREFLRLLNIEEESDSGNLFRPNHISSCRAVDSTRMSNILNALDEWSKDNAPLAE